jgi:hypothetical protein
LIEDGEENRGVLKDAGELDMPKKAIMTEEDKQVSNHREYVDPPDRALRFLRENGHTIGPVSRDVAFVDGKTYAIVGLVELADKLHHEDWQASEKAFVDSLLKPVTRPREDAPNAEDFDLGDQGQSGG